MSEPSTHITHYTHTHTTHSTDTDRHRQIDTYRHNIYYFGLTLTNTHTHTHTLIFRAAFVFLCLLFGFSVIRLHCLCVCVCVCVCVYFMRSGLGSNVSWQRAVFKQQQRLVRVEFLRYQNAYTHQSMTKGMHHSISLSRAVRLALSIHIFFKSVSSISVAMAVSPSETRHR